MAKKLLKSRRLVPWWYLSWKSSLTWGTVVTFSTLPR